MEIGSSDISGAGISIICLRIFIGKNLGTRMVDEHYGKKGFPKTQTARRNLCWNAWGFLSV